MLRQIVPLADRNLLFGALVIKEPKSNAMFPQEWMWSSRLPLMSDLMTYEREMRGSVSRQ